MLEHSSCDAFDVDLFFVNKAKKTVFLMFAGNSGFFSCLFDSKEFVFQQNYPPKNLITLGVWLK